MLSEGQLAALFILHKTPLERNSDGNWRPLRRPDVPFKFKQEDVRHLKACGFVEMMPIGAFITDEGRAELRGLHLI